ncbi:hypothetical protein J132_09252 [Termitomyces sp. J132]|nr:hypothetical protein J132_09252 [Termitomyces sp. J132]
MPAPAAPLCFQYTRRRLRWTTGTTRLVCLPIRLVRGNASILTTVSFPYTEATSPARVSSHDSLFQEKSFEEFYRSLQQSVNRRTGTSSTTAAPTNNAVAAPPPIVAPLNAPVLPPPPPLAQEPEERLHRLIRRLFLLPEIIRIVRAGLGAALRARI